MNAAVADDAQVDAGAPRTPPRGLLLDFGAVISRSLFECHRDTERQLGLPAGTLTWLGPLDPSTDPLWRALQRQQISERDYWALRARELGEAVGEHDWDTRAMLARVRHTDPVRTVRPQIARLIAAARAAGLRVGILSNELELFYGTAFLERMDVLRGLDAVVDATHTGILKPDPRAYALAAEQLALPPAQILFVDDQFRNIAGAVDAGMQVHYFDLRDVPGNVAAVAVRLGLHCEEWR
ncbi:MAG: HAD family hydrolase [Gammaproteobacteria bacterium]|uniref:HAD family hydrolase n=1 Tax=Azohydromonas sp. TaxID=1872666 RepID=UPI002CC65C39|nr:HAD-IA family hydrolase [Azohydromonas sp.]HMM86246.1 HAD-IA family hydrolase [Azohydromonas sp.]